MNDDAKGIPEGYMQSDWNPLVLVPVGTPTGILDALLNSDNEWVLTSGPAVPKLLTKLIFNHKRGRVKPKGPYRKKRHRYKPRRLHRKCYDIAQLGTMFGSEPMAFVDSHPSRPKTDMNLED